MKKKYTNIYKCGNGTTYIQSSHADAAADRVWDNSLQRWIGQ